MKAVLHKGETKDSWRYDITPKDLILPAVAGGVVFGIIYWSAHLLMWSAFVGTASAIFAFMVELIAVNLKFRLRERKVNN
jgi:hypothetical protein